MFIDFVLMDDMIGEICIEKELLQIGDFVDYFFLGFECFDCVFVDLDLIFYGLIVVINIVVQEKGVCIGLIIIEGFCDVFELGCGNCFEVYNFFYKLFKLFVLWYL